MLMARELLDMEKVLRLGNIREGGDFILNQQKPIDKEVILHTGGKKKGNGEEPERFVITADSMKVKNIGNFRRMIHDTRLPSFLALWKQFAKKETIEYSRLEKEFEKFDRLREDAFKHINALERAILESQPEKLSGDKTYLSFWEILSEGVSHEQTKRELSFLRNAFAHSHYPNYQLDPEQLDFNTASERAEIAARLQPCFDKVLHKFWKSVQEGNSDKTVAEAMVERMEELCKKVIQGIRGV